MDAAHARAAHRSGLRADQRARREEQQRRAEQAADARMERRDQRAVRDEPSVGRGGPALTPLTVPARPPKIIAERGVFRPMKLAATGVPTITMIALTSPVAMLSAITSELAPIAAPVTGPTM